MKEFFGSLPEGTVLRPRSAADRDRGAASDDQIVQELTRVVKAETEGFMDVARAAADAVKDQGARLQNLEQVIAKQSAEGVSFAPRSGGVSAALQQALDRDSAAFDHIRAWNQGTARIALDGLGIQAALVNDPYDPAGSDNTTMPSQPERRGIIGPVIPQPRLLNFLRSRPVTSDSTEFVQLSTSGDVGYQEGEGVEKADVEFEGTKRRANIATIAGHTTASRQVLADHATLSQHIDGVLRAKLMNKLCYEIINGQGGNGDDLRIEGLVKQGLVFVPTATAFADKIGEAVVSQSTMGFKPGLIVMNPTTWFTQIATAKTETEKTYLFGNPASPLPPALWNLPVALEPGLADGAAMVLDLNHITVLDRERTSILVSNSHKDYFTRNLVSILGELRAGLEVLDTAAALVIEPDKPDNG